MNRFVARCSALAAAISACATSLATADLLALTPTRDATLYESFDGSLANGAGRYLFAGVNNQVRVRRGLVHFDVAGMLPQGAIISDARLILNLSQSSLGPARAVSTHRAVTNWTAGTSDPEDPEGSGTTPTANDATWLYSSADGLGSGALWQTAGGDFTASASATVLTSAIGLYTWNSAELLEEVRAFAEQPSENYGWFLLGDESTFGTARRFDSADSTTLGGIAPRLEIEYTVVPAPSALALLMLASGARRRRR